MRYRVPDQMRSEYLAGVDEVAVENFAVQVSPGSGPVLNEEHDYYRWLTAPDAIAIAHWPDTKEVIAGVAASLG